jgi:predicted hotdog family 3-hydroxylacyl-ACP dehydratase
MCLLDEVVTWDASHVVCLAASHRDADHPLRAHGRLGVASGIEYAAQAMAVHGALLDPAGMKPRAGYLTSVREVEFRVARLDDIDGMLEIEAWRHAGVGHNILYRFAVRGGHEELLRGRAAVVLDAGLPVLVPGGGT